MLSEAWGASLFSDRATLLGCLYFVQEWVWQGHVTRQVADRADRWNSVVWSLLRSFWHLVRSISHIVHVFCLRIYVRGPLGWLYHWRWPRPPIIARACAVPVLNSPEIAFMIMYTYTALIQTLQMKMNGSNLKIIIIIWKMKKILSLSKGVPLVIQKLLNISNGQTPPTLTLVFKISVQLASTTGQE